MREKYSHNCFVMMMADCCFFTVTLVECTKNLFRERENVFEGTKSNIYINTKRKREKDENNV